MQFEENSDDFGALPQSDNNREFQTLSFRAFENALPVDQWILRDERIDDAGVDVSIEVLSDGRYTNQRAQVQLKSTSSSRINSDGSTSLQVASSNLNYLLSGSSPIYILYTVPRDELRFVWARDELTRLNTEKPNWQDQETVTLRFRNLLTPEILPSIKERILKEARLQREVHGILGKAASDEHVRICIDPLTLRHTDPNRQLSIILEQGISLCNGGHPNEVVDAVQALNIGASRHPRVQLVLGYAYYLQGQIPLATAALTAAQISSSKLAKDDQRFLSHLRDTCDYHAGRLTFEEFVDKQNRWNDDPSHGISIELRLKKLLNHLDSQSDLYERRKCVDSIVSEVRKVFENSNFSVATRYQALLLSVHTEGAHLIFEQSKDFMQVKTRQRLNLPASEYSVASDYIKKWKTIHYILSQIGLAVSEIKHPLLMAEFYLARVGLWVMQLTLMRVIQINFSEREDSDPIELIETLIEEAQKASILSEQTGQFYAQQHSRLLMAQLLILIDKFDEAVKIAEEVLPIVEAMSYPLLVTMAVRTIEGRTSLDNARIFSSERDRVDPDFHSAEYTDKFIELMAIHMTESMRIPPNRLPIVKSEIISLKEVAMERINWCRHIELVQNMSHTQSHATLYASPLLFRGFCRKLELHSSFDETDCNIALRAFKTTFCQECAIRTPKRDDSKSQKII